MGALLVDGIGDTIRVSPTADPVEEVQGGVRDPEGARPALSAGPIMIACPSCGRDNVGVASTLRGGRGAPAAYPEHFEVAVLGLRGQRARARPGDADFGIAGGRDVGFIYAHGRVLKKGLVGRSRRRAVPRDRRWIAAGMQRRSAKMAKPAALAMAEASAIPLE
jgi:(E)-4-hydroxy-3-methylbut-2-enyl-diphosphate synthase